MLRVKHMKKGMRKNPKNLHKRINTLKTFFELIQLLKAIFEFFR